MEKNVAFGLERKKVSKDEVRRRAGEALELVQLGHLGKRKPSQLSGGQQQRVALARALVNHPRALLLDEPLGALDLRLRKQLQIELKRIQRDVGITFVHVTHDQEEAMSMADTIAVMNGGRIEQAGGAAELYERPQTEFVANFLGVSNLVDARDQRPRQRPDAARDPRRRDAARPVGALRPAQGRRRARRRAPGEDHAAARRRPRPGRRQRAARHGGGGARSSASPSSTWCAAAGGEELNVFAQNIDGSEPESLGAGRKVQLAWRPEHTFVVGRG